MIVAQGADSTRHPREWGGDTRGVDGIRQVNAGPAIPLGGEGGEGGGGVIRRHGGGGSGGGFKENRGGYPIIDSCCVH